MIIIRHGHDYTNEVQTIAQVFFPEGGAYQFLDAVPEPCDNQLYVLHTSVSGTAISAQVSKGGEILGSHHINMDKLPYTPAIPLPPRRLLMLVLYQALQQAVPTITPWGALTGIRPSKLVRQYLQQGITHPDILADFIHIFHCHPDKAQLALQVALAEDQITQAIHTHPLTPLALYISLPFCPTRCAYCSFNVNHVYKSKTIYEDYTNVLIQEIQAKARTIDYGKYRISSIYIGGGTPTALPNHLLEKIMTALGDAFTFPPDIEITVEAGRPDTLTLENLQLLKHWGVNRIAVNPQTLNNHTLKTIGRNHTAQDFFAAMALARQVGFATINTDLILGLPGESLADVTSTLNQLVSLPTPPENITIHTLSIKRASTINEAKTDYHLPTAQATEAMLKAAYEICHAHGYTPYYMYRQKNTLGMFENVGYAKPGHESHYNVGMMAEVQSVLGIGAGAVTKYVAKDKNGDKITREFNVKNPQVYIERII